MLYNTDMAKFKDYKENNGEYNMRADMQILDNAVKSLEKEAVIRFYGWTPPCASLGRNQPFTQVNTRYCAENGIDIVRRPTGGRGLFHDDEVTYSFVCPVSFLKSGESIISSYKEISSAIIEGFKNIGIFLDFGGNRADTSHNYCMLLSTGADLVYNGKKLIGSAQYRKQGYILQHGSVLFSCDFEKAEQIFFEKPPKNSIACINEINKDLTKQDVIAALKKGFKSYFSD